MNSNGVTYCMMKTVVRVMYIFFLGKRWHEVWNGKLYLLEKHRIPWRCQHEVYPLTAKVKLMCFIALSFTVQIIILITDRGRLTISFATPLLSLVELTEWPSSLLDLVFSFFQSLHTQSKREVSSEICSCVNGLWGWFPPQQFQVPSADAFWIAKWDKPE